MTLVLPRLDAVSDPRTKFLRCRVCGRRFRNDGRVLERLYDHLEARHPCDVYGFWHEVELAEGQAARELATIKEAK